MEIFNKSFFNKSKLSKAVLNEFNYKQLVYAAFLSSDINNKPMIFLSHKHGDLDMLSGVITELENLDTYVYIDSMDKNMPKNTSGETATKIKDVIKKSNKFILLATKAAIESYWCNWELGFGDTHKYYENIAILPVKEDHERDDEYIGNEYLQIYPKIVYHNGTTRYFNTGEYIKKGFYIKKNDNYLTPLKDWLHAK
jgi:hypothetical protein